MTDLMLLLVQEDSIANPESIGLLRFFIGFVLVLILFGGALLFTGWISRDD